MANAPTHWSQFDQLYNLSDPRPYFMGVKTGDYRMPGVLADILARLIPVLEARRGTAPRLIDFACGYGAVGACLRNGLTMDDLYQIYGAPATPEGDGAALAAYARMAAPTHRIVGVDIADVALDYAQSIGALDAGYACNVLSGGIPSGLTEALCQADMIYESGAIGDHVAGAMEALLTACVGQNKPWLLLCPRPRVSVAAIEKALARHDYRLETLVEKVRYRRAFSDGEMAEEIAAGVKQGLSPEECAIDGYFRVDVRIGVPQGESIQAAKAALQGFDPDQV
jgi:SAM-dependent methyltransferase